MAFLRPFRPRRRPPTWNQTRRRVRDARGFTSVYGRSSSLLRRPSCGFLCLLPFVLCLWDLLFQRVLLQRLLSGRLYAPTAAYVVTTGSGFVLGSHRIGSNVPPFFFVLFWPSASSLTFPRRLFLGRSVVRCAVRCVARRVAR